MAKQSTRIALTLILVISPMILIYQNCGDSVSTGQYSSSSKNETKVKCDVTAEFIRGSSSTNVVGYVRGSKDYADLTTCQNDFTETLNACLGQTTCLGVTFSGVPNVWRAGISATTGLTPIFFDGKEINSPGPYVNCTSRQPIAEPTPPAEGSSFGGACLTAAPAAGNRWSGGSF